MATHPSTNRAQCRLTTLIEASVLTTTLCRHHYRLLFSLMCMCTMMMMMIRDVLYCWQKITSLVFGSGLKKNCSFRLVFSFTRLTAVSFFLVQFFTFICQRHLSFMPLWYDARNDVLPCWIGPVNFQLKWLGTRSAEIRHEDKYFESLTVDSIMLEMNCEWDNVNKKLSYRRETARQLRIRSWRAVSLR